MGCGGSKQQDVATGNTVTRRLLRRSSSVAREKGSEENGAKVSDTAAADDAKKAPVDGEAKLASKGSSSEEFFSSRREPDSLDAVAAGTEVVADSLPGEHADATANLKAGEEAAGSIVSKKDNATSAVPELEKKDKEETTINNNKEEEEEEEVKSVGKLSVDFKEAISSDEKEVEAPVIEKKTTEVAKIIEEVKNSGESKTAS